MKTHLYKVVIGYFNGYMKETYTGRTGNFHLCSDKRLLVEEIQSEVTDENVQLQLTAVEE